MILVLILLLLPIGYSDDSFNEKKRVIVSNSKDLNSIGVAKASISMSVGASKIKEYGGKVIKDLEKNNIIVAEISEDKIKKNGFIAFSFAFFRLLPS